MRNVISKTFETGTLNPEKITSSNHHKDLHSRACEMLNQKIRWALETYSNVHRGTGHFSLASTALYERAREVVLESLSLDKTLYQVIFCSPYGAEQLRHRLKPGDYRVISSHEIGLPLGITAFVAKKKKLPKGVPFHTGGNVARMVSRKYVIWANAPERLEPGTPAVINAIAFAAALQIRKQFGADCFRTPTHNNLSVWEILYSDTLAGYSGLKLLSETEECLFGKELKVPVWNDTTTYINFDNAASTPSFLPIVEAIEKVWGQSSFLQRDLVSESRKIISDFLGAGQDAYKIIFTSNTTEALNFAAKIFSNQQHEGEEPVVLNTAMEHNSNLLPWRYAPGMKLVSTPVSEEGFIDMAQLEEMLQKYNKSGAFGNKRIRLVAVSGISNVLGTYNNLRAISTIVHRYGASLLVDGAQLVAHRSVDMQHEGIDILAFSGHKIYAPFGSGALIIRKDLISEDMQAFGNLPESGEENVTGIVAIAKAMVLLKRIGMDVVEEKERILVGRLLKGLAAIRGVQIYGIRDPYSDQMKQKGGIISFSFRKIPHEFVACGLAGYGGIGLRYGCFCAHMLVKQLLKVPASLQVVQNIIFTLSPQLASKIPGLMRVSFGLGNQIIDADRFIDVLESVVAEYHSGNRKHNQQIKEVEKEMEVFCQSRIGMVF